jgi:hypothetical protein
LPKTKKKKKKRGEHRENLDSGRIPSTTATQPPTNHQPPTNPPKKRSQHNAPQRTPTNTPNTPNANANANAKFKTTTTHPVGPGQVKRDARLPKKEMITLGVVNQPKAPLPPTTLPHYHATTTTTTTTTAPPPPPEPFLSPKKKKKKLLTKGIGRPKTFLFLPKKNREYWFELASRLRFATVGTRSAVVVGGGGGWKGKSV